MATKDEVIRLRVDSETKARWTESAKRDEAPSLADWIRAACDRRDVLSFAAHSEEVQRVALDLAEDENRSVTIAETVDRIIEPPRCTCGAGINTGLCHTIDCPVGSAASNRLDSLPALLQRPFRGPDPKPQPKAKAKRR